MPNRLIHQTSPYLLQHAHNPVDWYPWGKEALQKAKEENKVILVSIGYSACHWCHVMERESFEDPETAALMNENFINIKIDREERPDLDQIYMDAVQLISGSGGWPLNVFLTPDAKPFYGGTYFPPRPVYNRSSWQDVLAAIQAAWQEKNQSLLQQADDLTNHLMKTALFEKTEGGGFEEEDLSTIAANLLKNADTAWGGFGNAPKFPQTFSIQFLLRQYYFLQNKKAGADEDEAETANTALLNQALLSLDKMIMGGIYDQLGGGFSRYSTDTEWLVPHFEKMLYDNALLVTVLSEAYQLTGKALYRQTIGHTMEFISKEWQDEDGGFFSAYDADSEGEEGKFYTWTLDEVQQLLSDPAKLELFNAYYGLEENGNWENTNILWVQQPLDIFCTVRGLDLEKTAAVLDECRKTLLAHRDKRVKPLLDDKKIFGWNALMITACCDAWMATGHDHYLEMALKAESFIAKNLKTTDGGYHHNYKNGTAANPAFLEDYACHIEGQIKLHECTGDAQYLENATRLTHKVLADFFDDQSGFFFYTHKNQEDILFRKKEMYDGATPSGNRLMGQNLYYLATLLDIQEWKEIAQQMARQVRKLVSGYPGSFAGWAQLLQSLVYGLKEIAVVGESHRVVSKELLGMYLPDKVFQQAATGSDSFPLLKGKMGETNQALIYLCFRYNCQKPVSSVAALKGLLT